MAVKIALIILVCAVATTHAEAPFRGYSSRVQQQQQQQQLGPYPAAGFRPDRPFNLPSDEAIAQQLRLAQIVKLQRQLAAAQAHQQQQQQQRQQQQRQQQRPSQLYGAPLESESSLLHRPSTSYGTPLEEAISQQRPQLVRPQRPSAFYDTPQEESLSPSQLTRPQRPSQLYGTPQDTAASQQQPRIVRLQPQPSRQYGAPQDAESSQRQVQRQPARQYGPPPQEPSTTQATLEAESVEESKEVDTVAAVANAIDNKAGRLTQGERDTENDEAEATQTTAAAAAVPAQPTGLVLVPLAGYTPQKLAYFQAPTATATFAKLQLPTVLGVQQPAASLLAAQNYYQPQQFAFASPLQAW